MRTPSERDWVALGELLIIGIEETRAGHRLVREVLRQMGVTQADLDAIASKLDQFGNDFSDGLGQLETEIATLKADNPNLNLDGVNSAVGKISSAHDQLQTDVAQIATSPTGTGGTPATQDPSQVNANQAPVPDVTNTGVVPDPQVPVIGQTDGQPSVDPSQPSDPSQPQQPSDAGTATSPSDPSASAAATDPAAQVDPAAAPSDPANTDAQALAAQGDSPAAVGD